MWGTVRQMLDPTAPMLRSGTPCQLRSRYGFKVSLKVYSSYASNLNMEGQERVAGGIFVFVLMLFTAVPFNDQIQGLALATGATEGVIAFAIVFPVLYVGLIFTVLAFTGYEAIKSIG